MIKAELLQPVMSLTWKNCTVPLLHKLPSMDITSRARAKKLVCCITDATKY
uniref:Uncharacterized protein n=1 Tax=Oryza brachyantha TaxID=4533 RepID=J3NDU7_ORYBR